MRYRIVKTKIKTCTKNTYELFLENNFNKYDHGSHMFDNLPCARNNDDSYALYIKHKGKLLAWALVLLSFNTRRTCDIWVVPRYRRQGLGRLLVKRIAYECAKEGTIPDFSPHDKRSEDFFGKLVKEKIISSAW